MVFTPGHSLLGFQIYMGRPLCVLFCPLDNSSCCYFFFVPRSMGTLSLIYHICTYYTSTNGDIVSKEGELCQHLYKDNSTAQSICLSQLSLALSASLMHVICKSKTTLTPAIIPLSSATILKENKNPHKYRENEKENIRFLFKKEKQTSILTLRRKRTN